MVVADIVSLYVECIQYALPFSLVFFFCDFLVTTIIRSAFGGKLTFRGSL